MNQTYVVLDETGAVTNIVDLDIASAWAPPPGHIAVLEADYCAKRGEDKARIAAGTVDENTGPAPRVISPLAFRRRFTDAERGAITLAASIGLEAGQPRLQVWLDDLSAAGEISLDSPELRAGLDALVVAKLLPDARLAQLLA